MPFAIGTFIEFVGYLNRFSFISWWQNGRGSFCGVKVRRYVGVCMAAFVFDEWAEE
jgi:hypothetical protein